MAGINFNLNSQTLGQTAFPERVAPGIFRHLQALAQQAYLESQDLRAHFARAHSYSWHYVDGKEIFESVLAKRVQMFAQSYLADRLPMLPNTDWDNVVEFARLPKACQQKVFCYLPEQVKTFLAGLGISEAGTRLFSTMYKKNSVFDYVLKQLQEAKPLVVSDPDCIEVGFYTTVETLVDLKRVAQVVYVMFLQTIAAKDTAMISDFLMIAPPKMQADLATTMSDTLDGRIVLAQIIHNFELPSESKVKIIQKLCMDDLEILRHLPRFALTEEEGVKLFVGLLDTLDKAHLPVLFNYGGYFPCGLGDIAGEVAIKKPELYLLYAQFFELDTEIITKNKLEIIFRHPLRYLKYLFDGEKLVYPEEVLLDCVELGCKETLSGTAIELYLAIFNKLFIHRVPTAFKTQVTKVVIEALVEKLTYEELSRRQAVIITLVSLRFADDINEVLLPRLIPLLSALPTGLVDRLKVWTAIKNANSRGEALTFAYQCYCGANALFPSFLWPLIGEAARVQNADLIALLEQMAFKLSYRHECFIEALLNFEKTGLSKAPFVIPLFCLSHLDYNPDADRLLFSIKGELERYRRVLKNRTHLFTQTLFNLLPIYESLSNKQKALELILSALTKPSVEEATQTLANLSLLFQARTYKSLGCTWNDDQMKVHLYLALKRITGVDPATIPEFEKKYAATFGRLRVRLGFENYLVGLEGMQATLGTFMKAVLLGRFHVVRYDHESSAHLKDLYENYRAVYWDWRNTWPSEPTDLTYKGQMLWVDDTDDWNDLLLAGTEVPESCQSIYASGLFKQALMAFALDGKHRMVTLTLEDGTIIARCMLRILFDQEGKPALFLEQYYGPRIPKLFEAITDKAKERAIEMGLPLYMGDKMKTNMYVKDQTLCSKGSLAPYEYVDALKKEMEGPYTIDNIYLVPTHPIDFDKVTIYQSLKTALPFPYTETLHKAAFCLNEKLGEDVWGNACRTYIAETGDEFSYNGESAEGHISHPRRLLELLQL